MKVSTVFRGIECHAEGTDGIALRGLVPSEVLEDVLGAAPSETGWLTAARAHSGAIRWSVEQEGLRVHRKTVAITAKRLTEALEVTGGLHRGEPQG